jgi:hypothetical protein
VIEFNDNIPFLQVQPVRKHTYSDRFLNNFTTASMADLTPADWAAFHKTVVTPNLVAERRPGQYAVAVRKAAASRARSDAA